MCFAVKRGEADYRLDVAYNNPFSERVAPSVFPHKPLKELVHSFSGGTPSKAEARYWTGEIPWVSPKDFRDFYIRGSEDHISEEGRVSAGLMLIPAGSVLVVVRSGILKHTLPIGLTTVPVTVNQDLKAFIPEDEISGTFLANYLSVVGNKLLAYITKHSTTVQSVNTTELDLLSIPVPPLDVQQSLVADMDAAREARRDTLARADGLLSGLDGYLLEQLGLTAPAEDKRQVYAVRLSQLQRRIDSFFYTPSLIKTEEAVQRSNAKVVPLLSLLKATPMNGVDARDYQETGQQYLRVQNVRPFELSLEDVKYVSKDAAQSGLFPKDVLLEAGDVLLTRKGTFGVAAVVPKSAEHDLISSEIMLLRLKLDALCSAEYLVAWLNCSVGKRLLDRRKTGGIMGHITQETVGEFPVLIPDKATQQAIADEVSRRRAEARHLRQEAEGAWAAAKTRFERRLLGEGAGTREGRTAEAA